MTLREATDESGHLLYATDVGIEIESVTRDASEIWRIYPKQPIYGVSRQDVFKFQLAGIAALVAMDLTRPEDVFQEDFATVLQDMITDTQNPLSPELARAVATKYLREVVTLFGEQRYRDALTRCAQYLQAHDGISGESVMEVARGFF